MVIINFSSAVRAATKGNRSTEIKFDGKLSGLINELANIYGIDFERRVIDNGQIKKYINVYINGTDVRYIDNINSQVTNKDTVDLIPSVAGG